MGNISPQANVLVGIKFSLQPANSPLHQTLQRFRFMGRKSKEKGGAQNVSNQAALDFIYFYDAAGASRQKNVNLGVEFPLVSGGG